MKKAAENKKPATSEIAGGGLLKSELCLSYVGRITHPRQRWLLQQQAHGRQLLSRVASMGKCYPADIRCGGSGKDSLILGIITTYLSLR